ncbi:MAG: type restriction enzyme protein [Blastocatellia bacterium]|jgi:type I restriction enzyme M protein|nr:type restriction enzyme protein [Blastocatellia bacterium]
MNFTSTAAFIWSVADLLRGDYKQSDYGKVILPFTLLRRLDCVLDATKADVLVEFESKKPLGVPLHPFLIRKSRQSFYNTSPFDFQKLLGDPNNIKANLAGYINGFSENARDIFERYNFNPEIERLDNANLLYQIVQKFAAIDLHPDKVSNAHMGLIFEELIRRFAELSNETAGEHYTPREVIRLMVNLLFIADDDVLSKSGIVRNIYDPTAGTGGMLSIAEEHLRKFNPAAKLVAFGQELNPESYAICKADMLIKGQDVANIIFGNTLSDDGHAGKTFDYMLSNPPFGVEWKKVFDAVDKEHKQKGHAGRFGAGLPRVSDGSLLFLLHLLSKMRPVEQGGSRVGIVFNGSPLFTGGAGSGESNIRKWVIENDWLEAVIALPTDMFYNTGISTYVWILTNHKKPERRGKIQLINAAEFYRKMRKSLGSKRKELSDDDIARITRLYGDFEEGEHSRIFDNADFGYSTITVERPLCLRTELTDERRMRLDEACAREGDTDLPSVALKLAFYHGNDAKYDFNSLWAGVEAQAQKLGIKLTARRARLFREYLCERDEDAEPVISKHEKLKSGETLTERDRLSGRFPLPGNSKGHALLYEPDPTLRDTENVPLKDDIEAYFKREVLPHVSDAWIDYDKTKVGYEIPFNRHFYKYTPPRSLEEIDADLQEVNAEIIRMLQEVTA